MAEDNGLPDVYDLTKVLRHSDAERRQVVFTFDVPHRLFLILIIGFVPVLLVTMVVFQFAGEYAIFTVPILYGGAYLALDYRMRSGLRLTPWQAANNRRKAEIGRFYLSGFPISAFNFDFGIICQNTVPTNIDHAEHLDAKAGIN